MLLLLPLPRRLILPLLLAGRRDFCDSALSAFFATLLLLQMLLELVFQPCSFSVRVALCDPMRLFRAHGGIVGTPDPATHYIAIPNVIATSMHVLLFKGARNARPCNGAEALRVTIPVKSWIAATSVVLEGVPLVQGTSQAHGEEDVRASTRPPGALQLPQKLAGAEVSQGCRGLSDLPCGLRIGP